MVIEAEKSIGIMATLFAFIGGAIVFTIADIIAEKKGGGAGILLGIGLDSIPESLAIGARYCFWSLSCFVPSNRYTKYF